MSHDGTWIGYCDRLANVCRQQLPLMDDLQSPVVRVPPDCVLIVPELLPEAHERLEVVRSQWPPRCQGETIRRTWRDPVRCQAERSNIPHDQSGVVDP